MPLVVKYVLKHPSGRRDYRRPFPVKLIPHVDWPSSQFKKSLGREDDRGFLSRYEAANDEYAALTAKAQKRLSGAYDTLDAPTLAYIGKVFETRWLAHEDTQRREGRDDWADRVQGGWDAFLVDFRRWYAEGDREAARDHWEKDALRLLAEQSIDLDPTDETAMDRLCMELNEAALRVSDASLSRLSGKLVPTPEAPEQPQKVVRAELAPVPLLTTYDAYAASVQMTPRIRKEGRAHIEKLVEFLGHDDAARIKSKDVGGWRDHLLAEPARGGGKRSPVTVNDKYLGTLKAMLGWASAKGREMLSDNVAQGIRASVPKRRKLRERHFTDDEAKKILSASLEPAPARMSIGHRKARRWVPWLCAYSGARVGEVAQLRGSDIRQINGIWTYRITPEAGPVKDKEYRVVPIHPHLIEQGFLDIARAAGDGPLFYDPLQKKKDDEDTRHIDKVGERIAKWVREEVGVTDPEVKPNHAWRNLFKTIAVDMGMLPRVSDAITGHALPRGEVGRTYEGPFLRTLGDAIAKFPRFDVTGREGASISVD